jgi:hypothetical protein
MASASQPAATATSASTARRPQRDDPRGQRDDRRGQRDDRRDDDDVVMLVEPAGRARHSRRYGADRSLMPPVIISSDSAVQDSW